MFQICSKLVQIYMCHPILGFKVTDYTFISCLNSCLKCDMCRVYIIPYYQEKSLFTCNFFKLWFYPCFWQTSSHSEILHTSIRVLKCLSQLKYFSFVYKIAAAVDSLVGYSIFRVFLTRNCRRPGALTHQSVQSFSLSVCWSLSPNPVVVHGYCVVLHSHSVITFVAHPNHHVKR